MLVRHRQWPPMATNLRSAGTCSLALAGELLLGTLARVAGTACEDSALHEQGS